METIILVGFFIFIALIISFLLIYLNIIKNKATAKINNFKTKTIAEFKDTPFSLDMELDKNGHSLKYFLHIINDLGITEKVIRSVFDEKNKHFKKQIEELILETILIEPIMLDEDFKEILTAEVFADIIDSLSLGFSYTEIDNITDIIEDINTVLEKECFQIKSIKNESGLIKQIHLIDLKKKNAHQVADFSPNLIHLINNLLAKHNLMFISYFVYDEANNYYLTDIQTFNNTKNKFKRHFDKFIRIDTI